MIALTWRRMPLRLRHRFVTAAAVRTHKETLLVEVESDGLVGQGEAVPTDTYGQSLESAETCLAAIRPRIQGDDPQCFGEILDRLCREFPGQLATVAALDAALHDWAGKRAGCPVSRLLGISAAVAPVTSVTLGIDSPAAMTRKMEEFREHPVWKVKVGTASELSDLAFIRRHEPRRILRLDANMGWPAATALDRLNAVCEFTPELVEQPCRPDDLTTLRRLKQARFCPIVADESCVTAADVPGVADCVDGINIKLCKCGGIRQARRMIEAARTHGLKVMIGCMIESSLGIAAACQVAPLADWLDLDGHILLEDDPFIGPEVQAGRLQLGTGPGLGVRRRH